MSDLTGLTNFAQVLKNRQEQMPHNVAFRFLDDEGEEYVHWTYSELDRNAEKIARLLKAKDETSQKNAIQSDRSKTPNHFVGKKPLAGNVLLLFPPGPWFIAGLFACFYAHRVAVPTFPPSSKRVIPRLAHIIEDAQVTTILTTEPMMEELKSHAESIPALENVEWVVVDTEQLASENFQNSVDNLKTSALTETTNELALLQYTSGSTRDPLGTMLTHKNLIENSKVIADKFQHDHNSVGVIWLPPYHDMGLIGGILQPIFVGFPCVIMSPMTFMLRPLVWLKMISKYKATTSGGPNFAFDHCVKRLSLEECEGVDLSSWKVAFNGAEPINSRTLRAFSSQFKSLGFNSNAFLASYGLAEATLCASCDKADESPKYLTVDRQSLAKDRLIIASDGIELVGCGTLPFGHFCEIVDPKTHMEKSEGEVGEIWLRGPSVAAGYWGRDELSNKTFRAELPGKQGYYLRTGDLGALYQGRLYVLGRIKDLMIIRGRNFHPTDIEASVANQLENIESNSTAVFSIEEDGVEQLIVVQEVRILKRNTQDLEATVNKVRRILFSEEQLQADAVVLVKRRAIPKTLSGKVQRAQCRQLYLKSEFSELIHWRLKDRIIASESV